MRAAHAGDLVGRPGRTETTPRRRSPTSSRRPWPRRRCGPCDRALRGQRGDQADHAGADDGDIHATVTTAFVVVDAERGRFDACASWPWQSVRRRAVQWRRVTAELTVLLTASALFAGTVDAIAGGGGLVTVPALLARACRRDAGARHEQGPERVGLGRRARSRSGAAGRVDRRQALVRVSARVRRWHRRRALVLGVSTRSAATDRDRDADRRAARRDRQPKPTGDGDEPARPDDRGAASRSRSARTTASSGRAPARS